MTDARKMTMSMMLCSWIVHHVLIDSISVERLSRPSVMGFSSALSIAFISSAAGFSAWRSLLIWCWMTQQKSVMVLGIMYTEEMLAIIR